jgi:hypothetical protein
VPDRHFNPSMSRRRAPAIPAQPTRRSENARTVWIVRLVKTGAEGEEQCTEVMEINRPADLSDTANLGLTLAEAMRLLATTRQRSIAAQSRNRTKQSDHTQAAPPRPAKTVRNRKGPSQD